MVSADLLMVEVDIDQNVTVTAVTYNGAGLTRLCFQAASASGSPRVEIWYLTKPPLGNHTVSVNLAGNTDFSAGAVSYSNVDMGNPFGNTNAAQTFGNSISVTLTTGSPGSLIVGSAATNANLAVGSSGAQVDRWLNNGSVGDDMGAPLAQAYTASYSCAFPVFLTAMVAELHGTNCGGMPTSSATLSSTFTSTPTATLTSTPSVTRTLTRTDTQTYTPSPTDTCTPSITESATETPTKTATTTSSETPTSSATATLSASPSDTSTDTPTVTGSRTSTQTCTSSATASVTPTFSASPSPSPTGFPSPDLSLDLLVYDGQGLLVRDLGAQRAFTDPSSLNLSSNPFRPEQGSLNITAGAMVWAWNGENEGGRSAPDGPYQAWLLRPGQADLKVGFWLEHSTLALGTFILAPQPAHSQVSIFLAPPVGTQVELRVYDLRGELAANWDLPSGASSSTWDLRTNSGREISSGVYLVVAYFKGPGTDQWLVRKLAVWR